MQVGVGLRVVRGPDWEGGNEDGGEGYVGTVVAGARADGGAEEGRHDVATVQWDVGGERHVYRCGAEGKYDLRVIDSAPAGVVHRHMECSGCGSESIAGCVWRCVHCLRYYLCTPCYMKDRHSVWHHFMRIDSPEKPRQRTRVRCRYQSGRVAARGVFVGARVVRGGDWRWSDQDGGAGREGTVVEIGGWQSESSRSVAVVKWRESGVKNKYRLGHKGKVDLQCRVAAEGGHCYLDHLPLLGAEFTPAEAPYICAGDRVTLEVDIELLMSFQEAIGERDSSIFQGIGEVGVIKCVHLDDNKAQIFFVSQCAGITVATKALKKVEAPDILPDDVVRVIDDIAEVHRLQKEGPGWDDDMVLSLGQLGRVERLLSDGSAVALVNGKRWGFDPNCLTPAHGEEPEETAEVVPEASVELLMVSMLKDISQDVMLKIVAYGNAKVLSNILTKSPERVHVMYDGKTLLHVAAVEGRVSVTRVLLDHKADMTAFDADGETPLHIATHFNRYDVAKMLLEEGSDLKARNGKQNTPVHIAAAWGHYRILALYLTHPKCQLDLQNGLGSTPLCIASQVYRQDITRLLLEAGSDPTIVCMQSVNSFSFALVKDYLAGIELIMQYDQRVIDQIKVDDGFTPLHVAAQIDYIDHLCYLAAMDTCDLEAVTYLEFHALHFGCIEGYSRVIERLVGYGADVMALDVKKLTPLHFVMVTKDKMKPLSEWTPHLNQFHEEYVSGADNRIQSVPVYITVACFLVSEGASLEAKSDDGATPLTLCPPEYHSLLQLFARPERRGHFRGSLPRHPPPVPRSKAGPSCFLCEGPCDITFQPCGHTAMCAECAQPVKRCPTCQTTIVKQIKKMTE